MDRIYAKIKKANFGSSVLCGIALMLCGLVLFFVASPDIIRHRELRPGDFVWLAASLALEVAGLVFIVRFAGGFHRKSFDRIISESCISEYELAEDMKAPTAFFKGNIEVGEKYVIQYKIHPCVWRFEDMVWVYPIKRTTKYRAYGILPAGSSAQYKIAIVDNKHVYKEIALPNETESQGLLKYIVQKAPYLIVGYDDKLLSIEKNNFKEMVKSVEERKTQYANERKEAF